MPCHAMPCHGSLVRRMLCPGQTTRLPAKHASPRTSRRRCRWPAGFPGRSAPQTQAGGGACAAAAGAGAAGAAWREKGRLAARLANPKVRHGCARWQGSRTSTVRDGMCHAVPCPCHPMLPPCHAPPCHAMPPHGPPCISTHTHAASHSAACLRQHLQQPHRDVAVREGEPLQKEAPARDKGEREREGAGGRGGRRRVRGCGGMPAHGRVPGAAPCATCVCLDNAVPSRHPQQSMQHKTSTGQLLSPFLTHRVLSTPRVSLPQCSRP